MSAAAPMTATAGLAELADVGRDPRSGGYRRFAWTREEATCREWFRAVADARGMAVEDDGCGNLWAWWGDPQAQGAVLTGSHLDSVADGGAFDGPLGVVSAFAAVDRLRADGVVPSRPLAVAAFADEEGGRFGVPCMGSRLLAGTVPVDRAMGLRDDDGATMAEAMRAAGHDPSAVRPQPDRLSRIGAFVELHVEQGRALIDLGAPVAVGSGIAPHGRWRLDFTGRADHAGTTRLADRDDPMLPLAEAVLAARDAAARHGCVATVGKVRVAPGVANAIPSAASAWLDVRGATADPVRAVVASVGGEAAVAEESWTDRVTFDHDLSRRVRGVLGGAAVPVLDTYAGHDAGVLAGAGVPTAMLFVRNPTGVSHSPAEHAEPDDCEAGVTALAAVLADLVTGPVDG